MLTSSVLFAAICCQPSAAAGQSPAVQFDDSTCLIQAGRANLKTVNAVVLHTSTDVRQVPLGTNVVVQSGEKSEVRFGDKTDVKVQASEVSEDSLPVTRYKWNKSDEKHNSLVSHPISRRDAFILQTGSKVRPYRRQIPVEDLPSDLLQGGTATVKLGGEAIANIEGMSPQISSKVRQVPVKPGSLQASLRIPFRERFKEQCATFAIICSLIDHEDAFAIAASSFIFVFLAGAWATACFLGFGCSCAAASTSVARRRKFSSRDKWLKESDVFKSNDSDKFIRQMTASSMNSDFSGAGVGNFERQISVEAVEAVAAFARQCTPEVTTPELEEAFSTFKRQVTPDVAHFPQSTTLQAHAASEKHMQAEIVDRAIMAPDPKGPPKDHGEKNKCSNTPFTDGTEPSCNDKEFDKKWRSCGQGP